MKRFMIPRVVHCSEGCAGVLGTTENCLLLSWCLPPGPAQGTSYMLAE